MGKEVTRSILAEDVEGQVQFKELVIPIATHSNADARIPKALPR
jgi:hypothetical protein